MSEVAVVLSGCGVFDGTEVHEISAVCAALSRAGKNMGRREIGIMILNVSLKLALSRGVICDLCVHLPFMHIT